jgi:MFS family permease
MPESSTKAPDDPSTVTHAEAPRTVVETAGSQQLLRAVYIGVALLYWMALYLYMPTLPTYIETRSQNLALVGVVLSQYGLWQGIIRLPLGIAADWLGRRKPFIVVGIMLASLGAWIMGTAEGAGGLLIGRAVTGLAAGTWVPLTVAFSSLFPAAEAIRATAILTFVASAGRAMATSVTGPLNEWGGYALAFFLASGIAALALLIILPARETVHPTRRPSPEGIARLIMRRDVLLPAVLAAISQYANWAVTFGFMPILAEQLGATGVTLSLLLSMHIGLVTLCNLVAAAVVDRLGARRLVFGTFVLMSAGIGLAAVAPSLALIFAAQFCMGVAQGLGYPVLMGMSIHHVDDTERTTAMGLHQSVYAVGMFAGPWLSGMLADEVGIRSMFGITAAASLAMVAFLVGLLPGRHQPPT